MVIKRIDLQSNFSARDLLRLSVTVYTEIIPLLWNFHCCCFPDVLVCQVRSLQETKSFAEFIFLIGNFNCRSTDANLSLMGAYHDDCTTHWSQLRTYSSKLTVIIGKILLLSHFSFTFKPKIFQSFISSQLTFPKDQHAPLLYLTFGFPRFQTQHQNYPFGGKYWLRHR